MSGEKYWLGADEGVWFTESGTSTAYMEPADTIPAAMTEHSRRMRPGVLEIEGKNAYQVINYALSNLTVVVGEDGVILVDPPEDVEKGKRQLEEIRKITDKPIRAVIYSHWHTDHYAGVKAFVSQQQVDAGECEIIAHRDFMDNVIENQISGDGPIIAARLDYSLGSMLEVGPQGRVNGGDGPDFVMQTISLIAPTVLVDDRLEHTVAGVRMVLQWAPSEAIDEIITWFPDLGILQSAEVIQGESYPNLHSIRGTRYRDPQQWFRTIDKHLRPLPAEFMVPSHGRLVAGREQVAACLRDYRDAISFTYDQTLRHMNLGYLPDDLVRQVTLPPHLAGNPWMGEFYGAVSHAVREIYVGELGWFNSDPTTLMPLHPQDSSARYIELMGGRDQVLAAARAAIDAGDWQWAAELASHLVRVDRDTRSDTEAREVKARALRELGYRAVNANWRNYYLTAARELDGTIDYTRKINIDAPDQIVAMPAEALLEGLRVRIDPAKCGEQVISMGFAVTDRDVSMGLQARKGVLEPLASIPGDAVAVAEITHQVLLGMIYRDLHGTLAAAVSNGAAKLTKGTLEAAAAFLGLFDPPSTDPVLQADR
jgi:alkyl sulfatase BDS1-like metallo-beta-lactamase superfamily hydrolase